MLLMPTTPTVNVLPSGTNSSWLAMDGCDGRLRFSSYEKNDFFLILRILFEITVSKSKIASSTLALQVLSFASSKLCKF
jgi:hypothetical protein